MLSRNKRNLLDAKNNSPNIEVSLKELNCINITSDKNWDYIEK